MAIGSEESIKNWAIEPVFGEFALDLLGLVLAKAFLGSSIGRAIGC